MSSDSGSNRPSSLPQIINIILAGITMILIDRIGNLFEKNTYLGLFIAFAVIIIFVAEDIFGATYSEIKKRLSGRIADRLLGIFAGYRRQYLSLIKGHHIAIDKKTQRISRLGLFVTDVYVELAVTKHKEVATLGTFGQKGFGGQPHEIWYFIETEKDFAIIGQAGSGKSTLLQHIAIAIATDHVNLTKPIKRRKLLPFIMELRNYVNQFKVEATELTLETLIVSKKLSENSCRVELRCQKFNKNSNRNEKSVT